LSPAGWQPDPTGRYEFRYFNGERWTSDVSVNGQRFVDSAPVPGHLPGWGPSLRPAGPAPRGFAIAAFVIGASSLLLGWVPFIFALGALGAITAFVFAIIALRRISRGDARGKGFAIAGIVLSLAACGAAVVGFNLTRTVVREFGDFIDAGDYRISNERCTLADNVIEFNGSITNLEETTQSYTLGVTYVVDGQVVDSDSLEVDQVVPGFPKEFRGTAIVRVGGSGSGSGTTSPAVECRIDTVSGPAPFFTGS
jgi:hypothetical protein